MMKLGSQTGSLINHVMSGGVQPVPYVGMPATILSWTDRHPATVSNTFKIGKYDAIEIREDKWTRTDTNGFSEDQTYEFTTDPEGNAYVFKNVNGKWRHAFKSTETGRWKLEDGYGLVLGHREKYHDFSF